MMVALQLWCRVTLIGADGTEVAHSTLEGPGAPDLLALDQVAHLALVAARAGGAVVLSDVSPDMGDLLDLSGLGVEVQRQAEGREESLGVQREEEERHGGDLPA
jgi:hypothetical protein